MIRCKAQKNDFIEMILKLTEECYEDFLYARKLDVL